ncbi:MAG: pseudouridine synthase [Pseudomonadota bacterium]
MRTVILFNKPFGVLSQFSSDGDNPTLADFVPLRDVYPAGRLDKDSEGLMVLTAHGAIQHRISDPRYKLPKTYWVQVEGTAGQLQLNQLREGIELKDGMTRRAKARKIDEPTNLWPRDPPIRVRKAVPDEWLEITLSEGKNRQVRRMTAAVNLPTLRLIRAQIGTWHLDGLRPGKWREVDVPANWIRNGR